MPPVLALLFVLAASGGASALDPRSLAAPVTSASTTSNPYLDSLLSVAEVQGIHNDRNWHILLHYKRGLLGLRSLVDDPKFFADPNGKHDPRAELRATLRALFSATPADTASGEKSPACRFIARFAWLKEKLNIDEARLPEPRCRKFDELLAEIRPESVALIFPTSHMNSPASMYGHTLLTIESESRNKLLAYAVNYSAMTSGSGFAPLYMAKGLFGGYPGYFSILPYYAKLQEYSDVNDRDIWEYPLTLDQNEVLRLLMHVYELENIYSDYFFFSENCSYDLLFLLEAARPSLHLTDQFRGWVIPLDTIRAVKQSGLIQEAIYRPSKSTKVEYLARQLPAKRRDEARAVALGLREPQQVLAEDIQREEKIQICDLASEYLQYIYTTGALAKDRYLPRLLSTLEARSSLGEAEAWRESIPPPDRPEEGHRSNRLSIGAGTIEEIPFQEIRLRPAYHEILDNGIGYRKGSQIVFVDAVLRYYPRQERLKLEAVDLIDIVSIAPRTPFFRHVSWRVKTGFLRRTQKDGRDPLVYGLNLAFGPAYETRWFGLSYVMVESDLHVGGALARGHSLGGGVSAGVLRDLRPRWKVQLSARYLDYPLGEELRRFESSLKQSVALTANLSLFLELERSTEHDATALESKVSARGYF